MKQYGVHCDGTKGRRFQDKDSALEALPFTRSERAVLIIARLFFQTFADPRSMGWATALSGVGSCFSPADHPRVAAQVLAAVQAMRLSRRSCFQFSTPTCPCCLNVVTEHERRLILTLHALRRGDTGTAHLEMMMLCEGNRTDLVLHRMAELAGTLDAFDALDGEAAARSRPAQICS